MLGVLFKGAAILVGGALMVFAVAVIWFWIQMMRGSN